MLLIDFRAPTHKHEPTNQLLFPRVTQRRRNVLSVLLLQKCNSPFLYNAPSCTMIHTLPPPPIVVLEPFAGPEFSWKPDDGGGGRVGGLGTPQGWPWIHPGPETPCLCPSRQWALCKNYSYTFSLNARAFSSKSDLFHCSLPQHREAAWKMIGSPECVNNIAFTEAYKRQANNDVVPLNFSLKSKNSKSRQTPGY